MWPVLPFCNLQPIQGTSHQAAQSCSMESIRMVGRVGKSSCWELAKLQFCPGNWSCWLAQTSCRIPRCITYNSEKRKRISQAVIKTPIPVTGLTDPDHSVSKESLPGWQGPLAISFQTLGLSKTFEWNMVVMFCISFVGDLGSRRCCSSCGGCEAFAILIINTSQTSSTQRFRSSSIAPVS